MTETGRPAHRRRGPALEQAILRAAWTEILAVGFTATTMDGVAARAGTSKPVLYRRWPTRTDLLVAAVEAVVPDLTAAPGPPPSQSASGDLRAVMLSTLGRIRDRYTALAAAPGLDDAALAALRARTHAAGLHQLAAVLPDTTPPELLRLLVDTVHARATLGQTLGDDGLAAFLDTVVLPLLAQRYDPRPALDPTRSARPNASTHAAGTGHDERRPPRRVVQATGPAADSGRREVG